MRVATALTLAFIALGCVRQAPNDYSARSVERELVHLALAAVPIDSITGDGGRFAALILDPRIRRVPSAGPVDPMQHPVAFSISSTDIAPTSRTPLILRAHIVHDSRGDSLAVTLAIVGSVTARAAHARVLVFMSNERTCGIVGSVVLEKISGSWRPTLVHFQEG